MLAAVLILLVLAWPLSSLFLGWQALSHWLHDVSADRLASRLVPHSTAPPALDIRVFDGVFDERGLAALEAAVDAHGSTKPVHFDVRRSGRRPNPDPNPDPNRNPLPRPNHHPHSEPRPRPHPHPHSDPRPSPCTLMHGDQPHPNPCTMRSAHMTPLEAALASVISEVHPDSNPKPKPNFNPSPNP